MPTFLNLFRSRKTRVFTLGSLVLLLLAGYLLANHLRKKVTDPAFSKYIESYTTGMISKQSTIRIKLANDVQISHEQNEELKHGTFDFSPSIKGKAYWVDERTIEFKPDNKLDADKSFDADFKLSNVIEVPDDYKHFKFSFHTIKPDFMVAFNGLQTATNTSTTEMKLGGIIQTADNEDAGNIEKIITASYSSPVKVSWLHNAATKTHSFTITDLKRLKGAVNELTVHWDGSPLNVDRKGDERFIIPAIGDFKVLDIKAVQDQDQYVLVQFSDAIMVGQELNGLIGINNVTNPAYTIDGSTVKIFSPERLEGNFSVYVHEGVENISHKKITKTYTGNVFFENRLPVVTIPGKGVILPDSGKLMMPFEAVNLNAVDVSIIKIYADNVPQYFQNNGFDGNSELRSVGKPVVQKTIRLDQDKALNLNKKNRFMLDLDKLLHTEPGAIYRVVIGFRQEYSLYNCKLGGPILKGSGDDDDGEGFSYGGNNNGKVSDEDDDFWSRYDNYYPENFNWQERDNPCANSYYNRQRWATRNIIASNIGLVAKRGNDNSMTIAVTNILSAQPMSGVSLELLDFQKQVMLKTTSDADGLAKFDLKRRPYLLVAKQGKERGYLKLDDGSSLPLSRFNVGGDNIQGGLKGFIYGERGVWRPGDSIFLSFILQDKLKTLPADHPVEFEMFNPQGQLYKHITQTKSLDGFYSFHTATETSSPTGNWSVKIKVGGSLFEKNIKVETIMPNRLKLNLSFGGATELTKGGDIKGVLNAKWLFGGTAQNLKAKVDAFLSAKTTTFKKYPDYTFDDPTLPFNTQVQNIFDGRLDAEGNAGINTDIETEKQAPGQLSANFLIKVFEPGGNFSINHLVLPYNVYPGYVGIKTPKGSDLSGMLYTGKDNQVDIADVDAKGNPFSGTRTVELELYKIQWRWWWDESGSTMSNFTQDKYNKIIKTAKVTVVNGHAVWNLHVDQDNWGRYLLKVKDPQTGHSTGKIIYVDWPNWSERLQQSNPTEAAMLSFTSDKNGIPGWRRSSFDDSNRGRRTGADQS